MIQFGKGRTLLQLINQKTFLGLCKKWGMDKGVRSFSTWEMACTHIMAFVLRLENLREVEQALFVPRSTFSDANSNRSAGFFQELCDVVLRDILEATKSRKIRRAILVEQGSCKETQCRWRSVGRQVAHYPKFSVKAQADTREVFTAAHHLPRPRVQENISLHYLGRDFQGSKDRRHL